MNQNLGIMRLFVSKCTTEINVMNSLLHAQMQYSSQPNEPFSEVQIQL